MSLLDTGETFLAPQAEAAKSLGAYYTDASIADFLAWWAVRSATDTVLDPCFGGGVFLHAACKRVKQLGGRAESQIFGIEIAPEVYRRIGDELVRDYGLSRANLLLADFFSVDVTSARAVDAIIGNPPYIRYQRFAGDTRKRALSRSLAQGIHLPELCSSWAPFLIHCIAMLRTGGRLAMVLPMEMGHAKYAQPVLEHIRRSFGCATFLTFRKKLFPELNEDTLLLIAADKGAVSSRFFLRDLEHPDLLTRFREEDRCPAEQACGLDTDSIALGKSRLIEYLIPPKARLLYRELRESARAQRLGDFADVGIGYVTGANGFFHLDPEETERRGIPRNCLKPVVKRGRALQGLRFTRDDWQRAVAVGEAGFLLHIPKHKQLPPSVREYIETGQSQGIPTAYKCRTRSPWYCVPHVHRPDAFLTYMSGAMPRLVANDAEVYAPNTLHIVRIHPLTRTPSDVLAALWQTSLTRLSVEIEGHALGGGMLKLEPTEAGNVLLPAPENSATQKLRELAEELDDVLRRGEDESALMRADDLILKDMIGLSKGDCKILKGAANELRSRRGYGETPHGAA